MPVKLLGAALIEPLTLAEAKSHLRLSEDFTDDDGLIEGAISAARKMGESKTNRVWRENKYEFICHGFNGLDKPLELPRSALVSVEAVKYINLEGETVTFPAENYRVDADSMVGSIFPSYKKTWPETRAERFAVMISFTAGYKVLPQALKQWLKIKTADFYENPESIVHGSGSPSTISFIDGLLSPYIIPVVA